MSFITALSITATSLLGLVPSIICERQADMSAAVEIYRGDLPAPEIVDQELYRWKARY